MPAASWARMRSAVAAESILRRQAPVAPWPYTDDTEMALALVQVLGADDLAALSRYGLALGEAFQLRDDVLGVFGDPEVTGSCLCVLLWTSRQAIRRTPGGRSWPTTP